MRARQNRKSWLTVALLLVGASSFVQCGGAPKDPQSPAGAEQAASAAPSVTQESTPTADHASGDTKGEAGNSNAASEPGPAASTSSTVDEKPASHESCPKGGCKHNCAAGANCSADCAAGRCDVSCGTDSKCTEDCAGGKCKTKCAAGAECRVQCAGGGCETECAAGAKCKVACSGGGCKTKCSPGATCTVSCANKPCKTDCPDGAACNALCSGAACEKGAQ